MFHFVGEINLCCFLRISFGKSVLFSLDIEA